MNQREPLVINVREHRLGARHDDGQRGVGGRQGRRDDFVAGPDAQRPENDGQLAKPVNSLIVHLHSHNPFEFGEDLFDAVW